jgi:hypothetical protein
LCLCLCRSYVRLEALEGLAAYWGGEPTAAVEERLRSAQVGLGE